MRKSLILISFFLTFIFSGCADSVSDLNTNDVSIQIGDEHLRIENRFNHSIYYFAVESEVAAVLNWAPQSTEENRIKPNKTKMVSFDEVYAFEKGDEITVYYWSEKEPSSKNVKTQRIETE